MTPFDIAMQVLKMSPEERTYGDVSFREHPLHGVNPEFGSVKRERGPTMEAPPRRMPDEPPIHPSFNIPDTSTPPNPFEIEGPSQRPPLPPLEPEGPMSAEQAVQHIAGGDTGESLRQTPRHEKRGVLGAGVHEQRPQRPSWWRGE
jgi:hypothetical protein